MCQNTPGNCNSEKYTIKNPKFDSDILEEWVIFADFVHKGLVGKNTKTQNSYKKVFYCRILSKKTIKKRG